MSPAVAEEEELPGPEVAPAIHPARSNPPAAPPGPAPAARAERLALDKGPARDCFSNSARISGSTGEEKKELAKIMKVRGTNHICIDVCIYVKVDMCIKCSVGQDRRTVLQKLRHSERDCESKHGEQDHRVLKEAERGD